MSSFVVTQRLADWAIVGCYDLLHSTGANTVNLPQSTVVRRAMEMLIYNAIKQEVIPKRNQAYIDALLNTPVEDTPSIGHFNMGDMEIPPGDIEGEDFDPEIRDIASQVDKHIKDSSSVKLDDNVAIQKVDEKEEPTEVIDPNTLPTLAELLKQSPLDNLLRKIDEDITNETVSYSDAENLLIAVAYIYSSLEKEKWGTDFARKQVELTYNKIITGKIKLLKS